MTQHSIPQPPPLVELYLSGSELEEEKQRAQRLPEWVLNTGQLADLELLLNGGYSPLTGYMNADEYASVLSSSRLPNGHLWPVPLVLDVSEAFAGMLTTPMSIALRNEEGLLIATLEVTSVWRPDKNREAIALFGTRDRSHAGVTRLMEQTGPVYLGGRLRGIEPPPHYAFMALWHSPTALRAEFKRRKWSRVLAFPTRQVMHRAELTQATHAAREREANLVVHAAVGGESGGPFDDFTRIRCYEAALRPLPEATTLLSLCPLTNRFAGPRQALLEAIVRRNFGFTDFAAPKDLGMPGRAPGGESWHDTDAIWSALKRHEAELGLTIVPVDDRVYVPDLADYLPRSAVPERLATAELTPSELLRRLDRDLEIPAWFSEPAVIAQLRKARPPRHSQGFTVFFTGLSGAGKSTIAHALMHKLRELGGRSVSLLDGDIVRRNLSSELGFSRAHRDLNIQRIGFVAGEITRAGGIAICAPIAPYAAVRRKVRDLIEPLGGFLEVYVATPLTVCEARDRKGLYSRARQGLIKEFTGISDPYEPPEHPDLVIDASNTTPSEAANRIILALERLGYIR